MFVLGPFVYIFTQRILRYYMFIFNMIEELCCLFASQNAECLNVLSKIPIIHSMECGVNIILYLSAISL